MAFEETLDFYLDKATDEKNEEFNILALDCEIKIEELLKCTDDLQNEFTSFFELFDDLDEHTQKYTVNSSIDNTAV